MIAPLGAARGKAAPGVDRSFRTDAVSARRICGAQTPLGHVLNHLQVNTRTTYWTFTASPPAVWGALRQPSLPRRFRAIGRPLARKRRHLLNAAVRRSEGAEGNFPCAKFEGALRVHRPSPVVRRRPGYWLAPRVPPRYRAGSPATAPGRRARSLACSTSDPMRLAPCSKQMRLKR